MLECLPRTANLSPVTSLSLHSGCSGHTLVGMSADCSLRGVRGRAFNVFNYRQWACALKAMTTLQRSRLSQFPIAIYAQRKSQFIQHIMLLMQSVGAKTAHNAVTGSE